MERVLKFLSTIIGYAQKATKKFFRYVLAKKRVSCLEIDI
jgi:hypothetical protein